MTEYATESSPVVVGLSEKKPIRVLHVDGDPSMLKIAKQCLEIKGRFIVDTASSVEEAMEKLKEEAYDAAVSDYQMPGKDGLQFLKELRANGNNIPFIIFTGKGREEVAIEALNLGADQYLNKSGDPATAYGELAHGIEQAVEKNKAEEKLKSFSSAIRSLDGVVVCDVSGKIIEVNNVIARTYGGADERDLIGKNCFDLLTPEERDRAIERFKEFLKEGNVTSREYTVITKSGNRIPTEISVTLMKDKESKPIGFVGVIKDITERRRTEEKCKMLVEQSLQGIGIAQGAPPRLVFANPAMVRLSGYTPEELASVSLDRLIHPDDRYVFFNRLKDRLDGKEVPSRNEYRAIRKDGEVVWIELSSSRIEYNGQPAVEAAFIDITARKKAEEALKESEIKLRGILSSLVDMVFVFDDEQRFTFYHAPPSAKLYVPPERFMGKKFYEVMPHHIHEPFADAVRRNAAGKTAEFEYWLEEDGETKWYSAKISPMFLGDKFTGSVVVARNITERRKAELELQESEAKYRMLVEQAPVAIYTISATDAKITSLNPVFEKITGWKRSEWIGKSFEKLIHPEDLPLAIETFQKAISGENLAPYELRVISRSGEYLMGEFTSIPQVEKGKIVGEFGIVRDITQHKKAELAILESQRKFEGLFKANPEAAVCLGPDFHILDINPRFEDLFGYDLAEIRGRHIDDVVVPEGKIKEAKMLNDKAVQGYVYHNTVRRRKDGSLVPVSLSAAPITVGDKIIGYMGVYIDFTERKRYEENLSALNAHGRDLNMANSIEEVYELTLDAMQKTLGFEYAIFMTIKKNNLVIACHRGPTRPVIPNLPVDGTRGIAVRAVKTREPILVPDVSKDQDYVPSVPDIRSELAVPVVAEDRVLGVLVVESRKPGAISEKDMTLLQILASHASTAISNLSQRKETENRSNQMASLMKSSAEMIHTADLRRRLQTIAKAIREFGWRRVVISVRDENLQMRTTDDMVAVGITDEEREFLWKNRPPGHVIRERLGPDYERFKIGEFYYLPWNDPWVRKKYGYKSSVLSHLKPEEMVDWHPQDTVYAPLRLADGRIVGRLSMDDPMNGRRPTKESLMPLELFLHQAAVAIENARLIQQLDNAKAQVTQYAGELEVKVQERTKELVEAQAKLLKNERLAAIGQLAGMVGHDLRNPLTGIAGAAYYLKSNSSPKLDRKSKQMLAIIDEDVQRSNKIISDLLEYSGEIRLEFSETTPKSVVKGALSFVKIPKTIQVRNLAGETPRIRVDVEKMRRVFINIIRNAVDAMPKGGKLIIRTNETSGAIEFSLTDNGQGMTKCVLDKLWSPLFTTKAKGMGFGLPICKRMVEAHRGTISVKSAIAKGSTFTITLPISPETDRSERVWVNMPESVLSTTAKHKKKVGGNTGRPGLPRGHCRKREARH